jgi:hypothetical protein
MHITPSIVTLVEGWTTWGGGLGSRGAFGSRKARKGGERPLDHERRERGSRWALGRRRGDGGFERERRDEMRRSGALGLVVSVITTSGPGTRRSVGVEEIRVGLAGGEDNVCLGLHFFVGIKHGSLERSFRRPGAWHFNSVFDKCQAPSAPFFRGAKHR